MADFTDHVITDADGDEIVVCGYADEGEPQIYVYAGQNGVALTVDQITELVTNLGEAIAEAEDACTEDEPEEEEEEEPTIDVGDFVRVTGYWVASHNSWEGQLGEVARVNHFLNLISIKMLSGDLAGVTGAFLPSQLTLVAKGVK